MMESRPAPVGPIPDPESPSIAEPGVRPPLATSTGRMFATKLSAAVLSLVNVLIVARALGPAGRGSVVFLITVAVLSSQVATLSISEAASNIAGRRPAQRPAVATNAVILSLLLGAAAAALVGILLATVAGFGPHVHLWLLVLALAALPALILLDNLMRLTLADYAFGVVNVAITLPAVANVAVNGLLYAAGDLSVATAFVVWTAGQVAALGLLAAYLQLRLAGFGRPDLSVAREMLWFGLKSHGSRIMAWGNYRLDQWLVGAMAGSRELGLYSVAVSWAEGLFLLPEALVQVQRPDLVRAGRASAGTQAVRAFRLTALVTVVLVGGLVLLAPFLCVTVFGSKFAGSVGDLRVLAVGAFGIVAAKVFGNALIAQGKPLLEAIATLVAFAATLALDIVLIPAQGGLGAAIASTVAYTAGGAVVATIASRTLGFAVSAVAPGRADIHFMLDLIRSATRRPRSAGTLLPGDRA